MQRDRAEFAGLSVPGPPSPPPASPRAPRPAMQARGLAARADGGWVARGRRAEREVGSTQQMICAPGRWEIGISLKCAPRPPSLSPFLLHLFFRGTFHPFFGGARARARARDGAVSKTPLEIRAYGEREEQSGGGRRPKASPM